MFLTIYLNFNNFHQKLRLLERKVCFRVFCSTAALQTLQKRTIQSAFLPQTNPESFTLIRSNLLLLERFIQYFLK